MSDKRGSVPVNRYVRTNQGWAIPLRIEFLMNVDAMAGALAYACLTHLDLGEALPQLTGSAVERAVRHVLGVKGREGYWYWRDSADSDEHADRVEAWARALVIATFGDPS